MTVTELAKDLMNYYSWAIPLQTLQNECNKQGLEPMEVFREMVRLGVIEDNY